MDVAVSTSNLHAEGSLMENTSAEMSLVARQAHSVDIHNRYLEVFPAVLLLLVIQYRDSLDNTTENSTPLLPNLDVLYAINK